MLVVAIVAGTLILAFAVIFILRRKNKKASDEEFAEKKVREDENVSDGNSVSEKESADVCGK